jgi:hypothetical protein
MRKVPYSSVGGTKYKEVSWVSDTGIAYAKRHHHLNVFSVNHQENCQ